MCEGKQHRMNGGSSHIQHIVETRLLSCSKLRVEQTFYKVNNKRFLGKESV